MMPQIPEYVLLLESILRPLVMTIALGLIWLGAVRMPGSAKSRYTTAGVLSVVFIGWEVVAQYLGAANTYLATIETPPAVPTILFGLLIPLAVAAIGLWQSESIARLVSAIPLHWLVAAQVYRLGGGIFLMLWADGRLPWQFALPAGNRRPRRGNRHGGNDLFGTSASSCVRRAEPSHDSLSAGDGAYLRRPTRPDVA